jgi:hypothetical protein
MKKLIYLLVFTLGIISCNSADETTINNSDLIGEWDWTLTAGGINGDINNTPASTGNTIHLILNNNYKFTVTKDGNAILNGTYKLSMKKSIYSGKMERFISLETIDELYLGFVKFGIVTIAQDQTLQISDNNPDGITSSFVKIK